MKLIVSTKRKWFRSHRFVSRTAKQRKTSTASIAGRQFAGTFVAACVHKGVKVGGGVRIPEASNRAGSPKSNSFQSPAFIEINVHVADGYALFSLSLSLSIYILLTVSKSINAIQMQWFNSIVLVLLCGITESPKVTTTMTSKTINI